MKLIRSIQSNLLFFLTCFLLFFIPLYPKLPVIGVTHTWVYIRLEDFAIAATLTLWVFLILFKKVRLKTPLTIPIFLFWLIGAVSTLHGILILFPTLPNVFPNVALFNFFRHIEYLSLFFVAFSSIRDKRLLNYVVTVLTFTMLFIIFYGFGQKFLGFPAFLTGNEEFAKGVALRISSLGRVPSTFAGHYDLAAYLVLVIPIFVSLIFGFKNIFLKGLFFLTSILGFVLLFMTVSRVSFFVLIFSLLVLLISQRKKFFLAVFLVLILSLLILSPNLIKRFGSTLTDISVLVNAQTGEAISKVREVPREYFKNKIVLKDNSFFRDPKVSSSAILSYLDIPQTAELLVEANTSSGENLPQGTGYVNLQLSPIIKRSDVYFTEQEREIAGTKSAEIHAFKGNFLVKKARAYDLSFTTRFQGEWPRTMDSFKRNIFLGSGYGSVSLAVDNNYLRILGESGLFGFISFALLFLISGIFIKKTYESLDSSISKSFVLGFVTGTLGLLLNAVLIDVFEASKVAFSFWLLAGVVLGILSVNAKDVKIDFIKEVKKVLFSPYAIIIYILIATFSLFLPLYTNYFVGDDFTWLRWAAQSKDNILSYFFNSGGFFYRPGARIYFLIMYKLFWLNHTFYHLSSIISHFLVAVLVFLVLRKIFSRYMLAVFGSFLFLILSGTNEAVFWISGTGFIFTSILSLLSILFYIYWKQKKQTYYFVLALVCLILAPLFHELGVVTAFLLILYDYVFVQEFKNSFKKIYFLFLSPLLPYFFLRLISQSHWFSGDYSYSIAKLPFNIVGNTIGYFILDFFGPQSIGFYESLRTLLKSRLLFSALALLVILLILSALYKILVKKLNFESKKIVVFGLAFFFISLLPFLGLGNITSRYTYLSSIGFVIIFVFLVEKIFTYLRTISDKYTFYIISTLLFLIFSSFQLFQLQGLHTDWNVAGQKVQNFLTSFENVFMLNKYGKNDEYNPKVSYNFYFVGTPIKNGEAWVFPVGLPDSLWFALGNGNLNTGTFSDINQAFYKSDLVPNSGVFLFNSDGSVKKGFKINNSIMFLPK